MNNYISLEPLYDIVKNEKLIYGKNDLRNEMNKLLSSGNIPKVPGLIVWLALYSNKKNPVIHLSFTQKGTLYDKISEDIGKKRAIFWLRTTDIEVLRKNFENYYTKFNAGHFDDHLIKKMNGANYLFWIEHSNIARSVISYLTNHFNQTVTKYPKNIDLNTCNNLINIIDDKINYIRTKEVINEENIEVVEIAVIDDLAKNTSDNEDLEEKINNLNKETTDYINVNSKKIKRSDYIMSLIKKHRNFKCQFCDGYILKENGNLYVEACHIVPHHLGGKATLQNILVLCPNHHKLFDLGKREVISHTRTNFTVRLNGMIYEVSLK